jgi:hypothetical protein
MVWTNSNSVSMSCHKDLGMSNMFTVKKLSKYDILRSLSFFKSQEQTWNKPGPLRYGAFRE